MKELLSLEALGSRICIMGPSNSGKSTLTRAIARKTSLPAVHLDQLHHLPGSKWIPREPGDFFRLHADAVCQEQWVMDGNYTKCIRPRLERATGLILLDLPVTTGVLRYLRRCYSSKPRIGGLRSGREHVSLKMLNYITRIAPQNRLRYLNLYDKTCLPKLLLATPDELKTYMERWGLSIEP
ncbi:AAA family ATPase [Candidatus Pantoea formicae]|uniref:AAA family ATPase n=1 Tax=Candidatus Pantoea formicae TaxID=2608355 RepID=UPI003EDA808C